MFLTPLLPIVLGFGFYVIYKGGVGCRVLGCAGLLLFSFIFPLARTMLTMYLQRMAAAPIDFIFRNPVIWRSFGFELLRCFLLAAIAIVGGTLLRKKSKFSVIALVGAIIVLITGLSVNWTHLQMVFLESSYSGHVPEMIFLQLVNAGFFMLAAMLAHMITGSNSGRMHLSGGARAWCIIVFCASGISLIFNFVTGNIPAFFQPILLILAVVGMIILSTGRRFGFFVALMGVGMSVMITLSQIFPYRPSALAANIGSVIGGCINPLITWALISRAWRGLPPPAPVQPTVQPAPQAGGFREPVPSTTARPGAWRRNTNGGSVYYSQNADSLYAAGEMLKVLTAIPPQTYYMVDTPEGTLGRGVNGFFTEEPGNTSNPMIEKP